MQGSLDFRDFRVRLGSGAHQDRLDVWAAQGSQDFLARVVLPDGQASTEAQDLRVRKAQPEYKASQSVSH